jgi:T5SS/PEP-CTERM-associated repeat protein
MASPALAQSNFWVSQANSASWFTISNWSQNELPNANSDAIFDGRTGVVVPYQVNVPFQGATARRLIIQSPRTIRYVFAPEAGVGLSLGTTDTAAAPSLTLGTAAVGAINASFERGTTPPGAPNTFVTGSRGVLGQATGSNATLEVRTQGMRLNLSNRLSVGLNGTGVFKALSGGRLDTPTLQLGVNTGGVGDVEVSGTGSRLNMLGLGGAPAELVIGDAGQGKLSILSNGALTSDTQGTRGLVLGRLSGGVGEVNVAAATLTLTGLSSVNIAQSGTARLNVTQGALASLQHVGTASIAPNSGAGATVVVADQNSRLVFSGQVVMGNTGTGPISTLTVRDGALFQADTLELRRGVIALTDGQITAEGVLVQDRGVLTGRGTINGSLESVGLIDIAGSGAGVLNVSGLLGTRRSDQGPMRVGRVLADLLSVNANDRIVLAAPASLGGLLTVRISPTFFPSATFTHDLLVSSNPFLNEKFDVAYFPRLRTALGRPSGQALKLTYIDAPPLIRGVDNVGQIGLTPLGEDIGFTASVVTGVSPTPERALLRDVNGDGLDDLIMVVPDATNPTTAAGTLVVHRNLGSSGGVWLGFAAEGSSDAFSVATGVEPTGLAVGDIDQDGALDVVVANAGSDSLWVYGNTGGGVMSLQATVPAAGRPVDVALVPLNGNAPGNRLDLVAACENDDTIKAYAATALAGFAYGAGVSVAVGDRPLSVAGFNPDQDKDTGTHDITVASFTSGDVRVIRNSSVEGGPLLLSVIQTIAVSGNPTRVVVSVLNSIGPGQNTPTIVTINSNALSTETTSVIVTNPDLASVEAIPFSAASSLPAGASPQDLCVADVDGDGDRDLVFLSDTSADGLAGTNVRVLRNDLITGASINAQLAFVTDDDFSAGPNPVALADGTLLRSSAMPGSGRDLAAIDLGTLRGGPPEPVVRPLLSLVKSDACSPADIANTDGDTYLTGGGPDGALDNGDFTAFFGAFFLTPGDPMQIIADIANTDGLTVLNAGGPDGQVDNGDFGAFFSEFFLGCDSPI